MRRVTRVADLAVAIDQDQSSSALGLRRQQLDRLFRRRLHVRTAFQKIDDGLGQDDTDDRFALARARNRAVVVRVGSATDQRRVAYSAGELVEDASRRCGGGKLAFRIEGNTADRAMFAFPAFTLALDDKRLGRTLGKPDVACKE